jgi:hypothetical protein
MGVVTPMLANFLYIRTYIYTYTRSIYTSIHTYCNIGIREYKSANRESSIIFQLNARKINKYDILTF